MLGSDMSKIVKFLEALDKISRECEVWIDTSDINGTINLIDENLNTIATGLENDDDTQEYIVD